VSKQLESLLSVTLWKSGRRHIIFKSPGDPPDTSVSRPATLDTLEEIIHHTIQAGRTTDAWNIYCHDLGGFQNLGWRLGDYERGMRICKQGQRAPLGRPGNPGRARALMQY
jgi:hypothetical protein